MQGRRIYTCAMPEGWTNPAPEGQVNGCHARTRWISESNISHQSSKLLCSL
jgi:hypothetical protein